VAVVVGGGGVALVVLVVAFVVDISDGGGFNTMVGWLLVLGGIAVSIVIGGSGGRGRGRVTRCWYWQLVAIIGISTCKMENKAHGCVVS